MYRECPLKCSFIKNDLASDGTFQRSPRCENSSPCSFGEYCSTIVFCPFYPVGRRKREKLRMACLNVLKAEIKILEATFSKSHERQTNDEDNEFYVEIFTDAFQTRQSPYFLNLSYSTRLQILSASVDELTCRCFLKTKNYVEAFNLVGSASLA